MLPSFFRTQIKDALYTKVSGAASKPIYWSSTSTDKTYPYITGHVLLGAEYFMGATSDYSGVLQIDMWGKLESGQAVVDTLSDTILSGIGQSYANFSGSGYSGCCYIRPMAIGDVTLENDAVYRCTHEYELYIEQTN